MPLPTRRIAAFFLRVLLLLVPVLVLWFWLRNYVVVPVAWLAEETMSLFFSDWVQGSELNGVSQTLLTSLRIPHVSGRVAELTPEAQLLNYCYGLPLLMALLLAAHSPSMWRKLALGALLLTPFQAWGVCFSWLMTIAFHVREATHATTQFSSIQLNLIGLGYQIGVLLLPTIAPVLLWLHLDRVFVTTLVGDQTLTAAKPQVQQ